MELNVYILSKMYYCLKEFMFIIYIIVIFNFDLLLFYIYFIFRDV